MKTCLTSVTEMQNQLDLQNYMENIKYRWENLLNSLKDFFKSLNCSNAIVQTTSIDNQEIVLNNEKLETVNTDLNIVLTECEKNNSNISFKVNNINKVNYKSKSKSKSKSKKQKVKANRSKSISKKEKEKGNVYESK